MNVIEFACLHVNVNWQQQVYQLTHLILVMSLKARWPHSPYASSEVKSDSVIWGQRPECRTRFQVSIAPSVCVCHGSMSLMKQFWKSVADPSRSCLILGWKTKYCLFPESVLEIEGETNKADYSLLWGKQETEVIKGPWMKYTSCAAIIFYF